MEAYAVGTEIIKLDTQQFEAGLAHLRQEAEAIVVKDQGTYITACQIALDARAYVKDVKAKMNPGITKAKALVDSLRNDLLKWVTPAEQIDGIVSQKAEAWKRAKREAEEREQRRLQQEAELKARQKAEEEYREAERIAKEQRAVREQELEAMRHLGEINDKEQSRLAKLAAKEESDAKAIAAQQAAATEAEVPKIEVVREVPKVAGIKARVNYKFEVINPAKVERAFLMPDLVSIGQRVRSDKNPELSMAKIGGIRVWTEDGI